MIPCDKMLSFQDDIYLEFLLFLSFLEVLFPAISTHPLSLLSRSNLQSLQLSRY